MTHYVCDLCGTLWASPDRCERCPECNHDAIWQFERASSAWEHAARISAQVEAVVRDPESWQAVADAGRRAK